MPLSSRSIPTGPGSRGGRWHDPAFRAEYHRLWRAAHPAYREREAERTKRRREARRTARPTRPALTTALRQLAVAEAANSSAWALADRTMIARTTLTEFVYGTRAPSADTIEALVDYFGPATVLRELRRAA